MRLQGRRGIQLGKIGLWTAVTAVVALQVTGALNRPVRDRLADLHVYWGSVQILLDGGSLYDFAAWNDAPFTYPPFAGLLFAPLALIAEDPLRILWTAVTLGVVIGLALLVRHSNGLRPVRPALRVPVVALLLFGSAPISSNLRFGQFSVALVALVLVDCLGVVPARYRGVLTGFAAAIKLTPMIFVVYWWVSGQRRTAINAMAAFAGCTALAWLVLPGESVRYWFTELWNFERVGNIATSGNQSLNGALLRMDVPDTWRTALAAVIGLAVVAVALARGSRAYRGGDPFAAVVIIGAAGLVFSPVSWTHHQIWLVLAGLLAVGGRRASYAWFALVTAVMVLPVTSFGAALPTEALTGNARLLLAIAVSCVVPFTALKAGQPDEEAVHPAALPVNQTGQPRSPYPQETQAPATTTQTATVSSPADG